MMGGVLVPYAKLAQKRMEHQSLAEIMKSNLERILATGCIIKDLDVGLLDFPSVINNEEVYLCWKLGEDRIRYYHRQDEGYSGRKPLDPRDLGPGRSGAVDFLCFLWSGWFPVFAIGVPVVGHCIYRSQDPNFSSTFSNTIPTPTKQESHEDDRK